MPKVCFYVMTTDTGFAPNPFHGICTLAACTPNHCKAKLVKGDLIAGCFRSGRKPRLVYVMAIDEVFALDAYYRDVRFQAKKPSRNGTWIEHAGDNIYYRNKTGKWRQDKDAVHHRDDPKVFRQDTEANRVFVGKHFVYYGGDAVDLPVGFSGCMPTGQGIKYLNDNPDTMEAFRRWAFDRPKLGRLGLPRDRNGGKSCGG